MSFRPDHKINLSRSLIVLLAFVFLIWTAGAHALPAYEEPSASSLLADAHGITQSSSDGSSPTEDAPLQHVKAEYSRLKLTSCALVQLAFDGPRVRLLSYPCLPQAPPSTL